MRRCATLLLLLLSITSVASARSRHLKPSPPPDPNSCSPALDAAEHDAALPSRLIHSIALVESGRLQPGGVRAWPWTVNVGGTGLYFDTKADAVREVVMLQSLGVRSIDVGCMQISLLFHPDAFASLDDAFDPATNAHYAAHFLTRLHAQFGTWPAAAAAYHSQTPEIGADYERRVMALWPLAPSYQVASLPVGRAGPPTAAMIDPHGIYTPEFAAQLAADAAARLERDAALYGANAPGRRHRKVSSDVSDDEVAMAPVHDHVLASGRHLVQLGD